MLLAQNREYEVSCVEYTNDCKNIVAGNND